MFERISVLAFSWGAMKRREDRRTSRLEPAGALWWHIRRRWRKSCAEHIRFPARNSPRASTEQDPALAATAGAG